MNQPMQTDSVVLASEASNFESIANQLRTIMTHVDTIAGDLAIHMVGQSGTAAQQAFMRYQEAALVQKNELDEISTNIHTGGVQYASTDEDQGAALHQTINIGI